MNAVTPSYYPEVDQSFDYEFEITGEWLTNLPSDARAYFSTENDKPLAGINHNWYLPITVINSELAIAKRRERFLLPVYLGVITSSDHSVIYYVNNSRPLQ